MEQETSAQTPNVATGHLAQSTAGSEYQPLDVLIGRWMTNGSTFDENDTAQLSINTVDIYEWVPGKRFIVHTAFGLTGDMNVGGIEMIGYDKNTGQFHTSFYDSFGNITTEKLTFEGDTITWTGDQVRCTGKVQDEGTKIVCRHERLSSAGNWEHSMDVTLTKVV